MRIPSMAYDSSILNARVARHRHRHGRKPTIGKVMTTELTTGMDDAGRRLDRILRKALPDHSLSLIHRLLRQGKIKLDGKSAKPETRVWADAVIQIPTQKEPQNSPYTSQKNDPSLPRLPEILARGSGIIVFDKPVGLASHGPESLDTIVKAHYAAKPPSSLSFRPGPLHRLDRPTSGAIAFSENLAGARLFTELLLNRRVAKTYLAIVEGRMQDGELSWQDGLVRDKTAKKTFVGGEEFPSEKVARTSVRMLACNDSFTLMEASIVTGRTHQIRAQAAAHGHPLAGDVKYGGSKIQDGGFFLHAWKIGFDLDIVGLPRLIIAPLPKPFMTRVTALFGGTLDDTLRQRLQSILS